MPRTEILATSAIASAALLSLAVPLLAQEVAGSGLQDPEAGLGVPLVVPGRRSPAKPLHFRSLPLRLGSGSLQLSNDNVRIDPAEWRSVAIASDDRDRVCTATLVGPKVLLLAAHCVDAGTRRRDGTWATVPADATFGSKTLAMTCAMAPLYVVPDPNPLGAPRSTEDFALCDLSSAVTTVKSETVATSAIATGTSILMMGYGCTGLGISADGAYTWTPGDRKLRMGRQTVEATAVGIYPGRPGVYLRTRTGVAKEPVLCPGDSGGPVMTISGARRSVVAVNSGLGAIPGATHAAPAFYSYLAPLNSRAFRDFLKDWVDQPGTPASSRLRREVCGYNLQAGLAGCRP